MTKQRYSREVPGRERGMTTGGAARRYFPSSPSPPHNAHIRKIRTEPFLCRLHVQMASLSALIIILSPSDVTSIITQRRRPRCWKIKHLQVRVCVVQFLSLSFSQSSLIVTSARFPAVSCSESRHTPSFRESRTFFMEGCWAKREKHPHFVSQIRELNRVRRWRCKCFSMFVSSRAARTRWQFLVLLSPFCVKMKTLFSRAQSSHNRTDFIIVVMVSLVCADKTPQRLTSGNKNKI